MVPRQVLERVLVLVLEWVLERQQVLSLVLQPGLVPVPQLVEGQELEY